MLGPARSTSQGAVCAAAARQAPVVAGVAVDAGLALPEAPELDAPAPDESAPAELPAPVELAPDEADRLSVR